MPRAKTLARIAEIFDKDDEWPYRVMDGVDSQEGAAAGGDSEPERTVEPYSHEWWLELRHRLSAEMFAEVAQKIHEAQKAAADRDRSEDTA